MAFLFWRPRASLAWIRETTGPNLGTGSLEPILWRCAREKKQKLGCLRTGVAEPGARPAPPSGSVVWMGRAPCGEASAKWRAWIGKGRSASRRVVRECRFVWREPFCWALRPADRRGFCLRPEPIKAKRSVSLEASLFAFAAALRVCVAARALFLPFGSQAEGPGLAKDFGRRGIALF